MKIRNSLLKSNQESLELIKKKLNMGQNLVDYFLTIGLDPEIALKPWLYEANINDLNTIYKEYLSPKIINKFPSFKKKFLDINETIIGHIFPLGFQIVEALNEPPKEKIFSVLLDNKMFSGAFPVKFATCLLFYEPLSNYFKIYEKYFDNNMAISIINNSKISCKNSSNNTLINVSSYLDNNSNGIIVLNDNISVLSSNTYGINVNNNIPISKNSDKINIQPIFQGNNLRASDNSQKETNYSSVFKSCNTYNNNNANNNININQKNKIFEKYYVPKCICLISLYPFINEYKTILIELYKYSKLQNVEIPLEKIINNLILEVPIPPRGLYSIEYTILEKKLLLQNSKINTLFYANFEFEILFYKFDIQQILTIFQYLMLGIKTIFFSSEIEYLTPVILSSLILLFPFKFLFPVVSVLPKEAYDLIDYFNTEILGVNEKYHQNFFRQYDISINGNLLVVDIDEHNLVQFNTNNKDGQSKIPPLPKKLYNELFKKLKKYLTNYSNDLAKNKSIQKNSFSDTIRNIFLEFQTELLKNYPKYLNSNIYNHPGEDTFNSKQFLKSIDSDDLDFYSEFIKTQMFNDYIYKRMVPNDKKEMTEVLFFEEKIFEKKNQKNKITFINSNIFNFTNKIHKIREVNKELNENFLEYYLNEENQKKLLINGIIINNNFTINDISNLHNPNNSMMTEKNKSLLFNYILFPKLNNEFFFLNETKPYYLNLSLNEEIKKLNARLISKSHLNRVETQANEINNYIYLLWLKVWANTFHYHDKKEQKFRYLQMMKIFQKINQHDMSVLNHLFHALIKAGAHEDLIYHLYIKIIQSNLSPTLDIFDTVKNMIKKNLKSSGMPSSIDMSKFLANKTKINFTKDEIDKKNFRERTMKNIYDYYTITEKVNIVMDEICGNCQNRINIFNFQKNLSNINDINNELVWAKCPFCKTNYLPKLKIIFGSEINKNDKLKESTSLVDEVVLYSPETLQMDLLDYSNIDIDKYKLQYHPIFWNLIWYFKLCRLPYDFILPYTENIFRPKKTGKHNFFKVNYSKTYDFININKKSENEDIKNNLININNNNINKNLQIKIPNKIIIQKQNIINNNQYNTIVHKINNNNEKKAIPIILSNNKTIKLPPKINKNIFMNNIDRINMNQTPVNIRQIRPLERNNQTIQNNIIRPNNKAYKILIPINKYIPTRVISPQNSLQTMNYYNYYNNKVNAVRVRNYPNYILNNNVVYNPMNNVRTIYNNYFPHQNRSVIIQRPIIYPTIITYNK